MKALALTALLETAVAPFAAMARNADQPPVADLPGQPVPHSGGSDRGGPDRGGFDFLRPPPDRAARMMVPGLGLAAHLAAAETYLGITEAQEDVWRDYCQALIAFLEPDGLPAPEDLARGDAPAIDHPRPLAAERLAQQLLSRADQARSLLAAATALRGALEPTQLEKLAQVGPGPGPERGTPGAHGPGSASSQQPASGC